MRDLLTPLEWVIGAIIIALLGGGIYWASVEQGEWDDACHAAHGTIETRFEYFQTVQAGDTTVMTPVYSYHCWLNGTEIEP